ncbi:uncharacterized protein BJ171DRAFT_504923 [Polychytrium aggregatum]|uniref:uncharacterized protein n=1 Tax=Polychytrium aggregatum TaxID=110093 RepID=UPI0022FE7687|nr:uncharacterized protein BJ171DRAFT_504923 [Polychytrium aggregatum]KAI9204631.1 hypothetical protein BJ171DRAFT_504923 [Polychytrium aggregatum]
MVPDGFPGSSRASRACDACRIKRIKCSDQRPCLACAKANRECTFDIPVRRRGPRMYEDKIPLDPLDSLLLATNAGSEPMSAPALHTVSPVQCPLPHSIQESPPGYDPMAQRIWWRSDPEPVPGALAGPTAVGILPISELYSRNAAGVVELDDDADARIADHMVLRSESLPFPDAVTSGLLESFFKWLGPTSAMFHMPEFFEEYHKPFHSETFSLLIWTVCIMSLFSGQSMAGFGIQNPNQERIRLQTHCMKEIIRLSGPPDLYLLQALILWAVISTERADVVVYRPGYFIDLAMPIALRLSLHLNVDDLRDPPVDEAHKTSHRSTFLMLYVMDRFDAMMAGRVVRIHDQMWDPSLLDHDSPDQSYQGLHHIFRLSQIGTPVIDLLNGPSSRRTFKNKRQAGLTCLAQLNQWWSTLPYSYRYPNASHISRQFILIRYHSLRIFSNRLVYPRFPPATIESARAISGFVRMMPQFQVIQLTFQQSVTSYFALCAAMVFLDIIVEPLATSSLNLDPAFIVGELNELLICLDRLRSSSVLLIKNIINKAMQERDVFQRTIASNISAGTGELSLLLLEESDRQSSGGSSPSCGGGTAPTVY